MGEPQISLLVNDAVQGHAPEFEQVHLLPIQARHCMVRVGQTDERDAFILPITLEGFGVVRSHREDHRPASRETVIILLQARQLRAAVRSHEPAQKRKHHRLAAKIGQTNGFPLRIRQFEIGSGFSRRDQFTHRRSTLLPSSKYRRTSPRSISRSRYSAGWDDTNRSRKKDEG